MSEKIKMKQGASSIRLKTSCMLRRHRVSSFILVALFIYIFVSYFYGHVSASPKRDDETSLVLAAENGSITRVAEILRKGVNVNAVIKTNGYRELSPLMAARLSTRLDVLELLLKNGAKINLRNSAGETALIIASTKGDLKTVHFLLKLGANPDIQDSNGRVAAIRAAELGYFSVVDVLTRSKTPAGLETALLIGAAREGNMAILNDMLRKGADVNKEVIEGGNALTSASLNCRTEAIKVLLNTGANVNFRTSVNGETPLHAAREASCFEAMKLLLDAGADPNVKDTVLDWTPLMWAANEGEIDAVRLLLAKGSDPNIKTDSGYTALDLAKGAVARGVATKELVTYLSNTKPTN